MQFRAKKKKQHPYVCWIKETNKVIISTTKIFIANELGIHTRTISRNMERTDIYETNDFIIWRNVPIHIGKARNHGGSFKSRY